VALVCWRNWAQKRAKSGKNEQNQAKKSAW
jgi:hypothetical protein